MYGRHYAAFDDQPVTLTTNKTAGVLRFFPRGPGTALQVVSSWAPALTTMVADMQKHIEEVVTLWNSNDLQYFFMRAESRASSEPVYPVILNGVAKQLPIAELNHLEGDFTLRMVLKGTYRRGGPYPGLYADVAIIGITIDTQ